MSNIATTIAQSNHLLELGLDPNTGDMNWFGNEKIGVPYELELLSYKKRSMYHHCLPAWSLTALLKVMPSFIDYKGQKYRLTIEKAGIWNVFYLGTEHRLNEIWFNGEYGDPVEPAYKMVCWLLEQGLIKKGCEQ